tara:strand:+ start:262 stop:492 length:231 start_codon:yes stop_codon:yes gene_type:complete
MKIFYVLGILIYFFFIWEDLAIAKQTPEFKEFCKTYMKWVNKYPKALSAGCCDIDHPSNDILKEEYLGDPMLICYG